MAGRSVALARRPLPFPIPPDPRPGPQHLPIRRLFTNTQIVDRFGLYLQAVNRSQHTHTAYVFRARQFAEFLGEKSFRSVTQQDVRAFLAKLYSQGLASVTLAHALFALRALFDFLQLGNQVLTSAPRYIQTRKIGSRLSHALSEEQVAQLFAAGGTPRDRAIIELFYASGLRLNEIANLRAEDVNLRAGSLLVRAGKGDKDRIALFGRPANAALRAYLCDRSTGFLFLAEGQQQRGGVSRTKYGTWWGFWRVTVAGRRITRAMRLGDHEIRTKEQAREELQRRLGDKLAIVPRPANNRKLCARQIARIVVATGKRAGLAQVHPHQLRHSMATHCLNRGMDLRFIQELLGHASLSSTQKYLHLATANLQSVHAKFHPRG